jgi:hypothetical protein
MNNLKRYLWLSQLSLFSLLIVCTLIIPSVASSNGGVSNFGNHSSTIVLYILAFALCSGFLLMSARILTKDKVNKVIGYILIVLALLELLVLVSTFPRHLSWTYSVIHDDIGIALFGYQFLISIWLVLKLKKIKNILLFLVEFIGSLIALLTILKLFHLLFIGQMIGSVGFGILLAMSLPAIIESKKT